MILTENLNSLDTESWPENDTYFRLGVSSLSENLKKNGLNVRFFFMNLNRHTLSSFIREFPGVTSDFIIIICSERLLPLAYFWLKDTPRVCAVFVSNEPIEKITTKLRELQNGDAIFPPAIKRSQRLTGQDLYLLSHYIERGEVLSLQRKLLCSKSTIYRKKMMVARKFGVKKIEKLFS